MIDLVLVNPNGRIPAPFAAIEPPLWLGLIAGYYLNQGKTVEIVDAEAEDLTLAQTAHRVANLEPKATIIVVMGHNPSVSSTPKMVAAERLLRYIPAKLTGLHPIATNYPDTIRHPFGGFPSVPWELLPMDKYRAHNWHCLADIEHRGNYGVLYTSLNCPFSCSYCNVHALYGDRKWRPRPCSDILTEVRTLADFGVRHLKIWDELFCLDEDRVLSLCNILTEHRFNIWAYARVDTVTERMLTAMKRAGFNWLAYGFESALPDVRQQSRKQFANSKAKRAIDMTRAASINIIANFMFGLPGETEDDMKASLEMAMRENFEYVNFSIALPYPGSEWYASLKVKPTDWSAFSQFAPNLCAPPAVVKFRKEAFQTYFRRPEYGAMIRTKFGEKAAAHIQKMVAWQIPQ